MSRQGAIRTAPVRREMFASPVVMWRNIFAVFDDGSYRVEDYSVLEHELMEQQQRFDRGLGCLVVIPQGAQRVQDDVRAEIERVTNAISVRCLCWAVLEQGFKGAAIRAALSTMNLVNRRKFPAHITGELEPALNWMLERLDLDNASAAEKREALRLLRERADGVS